MARRKRALFLKPQAHALIFRMIALVDSLTAFVALLTMAEKDPPRDWP